MLVNVMFTYPESRATNLSQPVVGKAPSAYWGIGREGLQDIRTQNNHVTIDGMTKSPRPHLRKEPAQNRFLLRYENISNEFHCESGHSSESRLEHLIESKKSSDVREIFKYSSFAIRGTLDKGNIAINETGSALPASETSKK